MSFVAILRSIKNFAAKLNLFESIETRSNPDHLRTAIITTRLYIILLTIAVFILVLFTALSQQIQTVTIQNLSEDVFQELDSKYSTTLQCSCSQVEIPYKTFINTSYRFHPVCSSVFVSNSWINLLFRPDIGYFFPLDFRSSASGQFQLLASLCSFANRTIQEAVEDFLSNTFLSPQVLSIASLEYQTEAKSQFLKTSITYTFRRLLNLVRDTTHMNSLQTAMQTSKMHLIHIYPNGSIDAIPLETIWTNTDRTECFCGVTSNCYSSSSFFDLFAKETNGYFGRRVRPMATVTGFLAGCYALDALLNSSLECFFNSTCLTTVLGFFPMSNISHLDILNINQTQYSSKTTIETLVNNLFIEHWSSKTSFSAYYSKCAPILCTYKFLEYKNILEIFTTLLGVHGGLTVVLRFFVPFVVRWWQRRKTLIRTEPNTRITLPQHLRNAQRSMKVRIIKLNLFETAATRTNPYELKMAIITTRIYLILILLTLSIITLYLLSSVRVYIDTKQKPSQAIFENLSDKYISTLKCPCSRIVNPYESFTSLSTIFHPVCSSLFVSDAWIVSISSLNVEDTVYHPLDFRIAGPAFFNSLAALCSLSKLTIDDAWYSFRQTPLITDFTLIQSEFQSRTTAAIQQFRKNTISEFKRVLSLVDVHTKTMYATGYKNGQLYTNQLANTTKPIDFGWTPIDVDECSCSLNGQCKDVMSFFSYTDGTIYSPYYLNFTLPDILIRCFVMSSVFQSSLGCFYNQTCLNMVQREIKSKRSINIPILDANRTRFLPQSLIGTMLDNLMIEKWNEKIEYDKYYERCAPEQCTYTYTSSNNPLGIVTTLFGLYGGLAVALKIIVRLIFRWIRKGIRRRGEPTLTDCSSILRRANTIWHGLKIKLIQLNFFKSELTWDDDQLRQREIITTRIYLLLLTLSIIILIIYTFIETQTEIVKVLNPSQKKFDELRLNSRYSTTLDCPCQNILVPYHSFISIKPHYHQLCSSDFVATNSAWIPLLYSSTAGIQYSYDDYRLFAVPQFQLLSSLCTLAKETVIEAIAQFSTTIITNKRVQSHETINFQANTVLNQFRLSTPRTFVRTLDFIRYMAQGNSIVSSTLSNWHFLSLHTVYESAGLWVEPRSYGNDNCSCGINAMCISQASFNGFIVPGFHVGCYPLEALLQSTLECLYNISCINQLKSMYKNSTITFNPLNATLSSPNKTVQSLVDALLVEKWDTNVIYEQYYRACCPLWCTYTFNGQISPIYTVTTIIALYGGLTVILEFIAPILVKIGYYIIRYRRRRVGIEVAVIS